MKHQKFIVTITIVFVTTIVGCSRSTIPVETVQGIVTLDGEPLADVTVSFVAKEGATRPAVGRTNEKGEFEMLTGGANRNGVMAGAYIVLFSKYILVGPDGKEAPPFQLNPDGSPPPEVPLTKKHLVPQKYDDRTNPLFEINVEKGKKNKFTFALESK